ncbi:hypothetical protein AgCh_017739 [Apium graveolens]
MASADSQSTIPNNSDPTKPFILISLHQIIKLTSTNYISWKTQLEAKLLGYDLYKFIDGSFPAPPKTVTSDQTSSPNPTYTTWFRQDKLIIGALVRTLSPSLVPLISQCHTTHEAWQTLTKTYANPSKGHLKQIKERLRNITKGNKSITEYMQEFKNCADQLASLGRPLESDDIVVRILEQLNDPDYENVVNAIYSRDTPISFDELHEKLINRELSIKHKVSSVNPFPATVNYAAKNTFKNNRPNHSAHNSNGILPTPTQSSLSPIRASRPYNGRCQ